ncbi:GAP family protein [Georgenia subflava]|uniref:GAP family protein n=1 Tax=Georgenia subflava TaxID=1622177 RepID=A0A6N7EHK4_9MICO|nr:GAP family protein [Georgenia subflava]MPV36613.1 GAP family protein [Georgenia subflava]
MTITTVGSLLVLALIDSTSFGTLLIPIWFLLTPGRVRAARVLVFLGTVATFYLLVGIALVAGADAFLGDLDALLDHPVAARVQLVVGVALLVWSFRIGRKKTDDDGAPRPGRMLRWRERAMGERESGSGIAGLMGLALGAAVLEVATMLPYLAATGIISTADLPAAGRLGVLAAYCLVMIAPALLLLATRLVARRLAEPVLHRVARWMERSSGETTAWIVGIVGFLVARDALVRMPGLVAFLDSV